MGRRGATRAALAAVALLVVAWSVVLLRNDVVARDAAHDIHSDPQMGAAEWARAKDRLLGARFLEPDMDVRLDVAYYLLLRDKAEAARVAAAATRDEPDNLDAWVALLKASQGRDARTAARALREIERLNPRLAERVG
jgi:hypothetical protein